VVCSSDLDTSDNIPGIKGVGEKTAVALIEKFGTLDAIYENLEQVEKRWKTKFEEHKEAAYMSRDLARIETNLRLKFNLEDAKVKPFDGSKLEAFFKEMEFKTLINKVASISGDMNITAPAPVVRMTKSKDGQMSMFSNEPQVVKVETTSTIEVIIVDTEETLKSLAKELGKAKVIAFDTETTGTEEMEADLVGISLSVKAGQGYYIPVGHSSGNNLQIKKVIEAITPAMTNPKIGKV